MKDVNEIQQRSRRECRACNNTKGNTLVQGFTQVYKCAACEAIFGNCYLGDSYTLVKPFLVPADVNIQNQRYFDFSTLGSAGNCRRHGWFDVTTKLITQVG